MTTAQELLPRLVMWPDMTNLHLVALRRRQVYHR